jgi:MFS family permease
MLDGMDVTIYTFVMPTLMSLWHLSTTQGGVLATSTLLVSAMGGWLAGVLADRYGRVKILQLTVAWFALFTCLSGFMGSFFQLLVVRGLQGLGFGGEWAVGSVLMGETIRAEHRGKAVGTVQSGWAIGWGIAALCFVASFQLFPQELAWRVMFWIGILPALLIFYIRGRVAEPELFLRQSKKRDLPFRQIFAGETLRHAILASFLSLGAQGGYYAIMTWLPVYLKNTHHLSVLDTGSHLAVVILGSFLGYLVSAWLTDRIGRRSTLILFALCSLATVCSYTFLFTDGSLMLWLGFPLGFFSSGSFSPMGSFFTELFPTVVRASTQGFVYNIGRGLGALFPALVGYLSSRLPLGTAIGLFSLSAYLLMTISALLLPETRGKKLSV